MSRGQRRQLCATASKSWTGTDQQSTTGLLRNVRERRIDLPNSAGVKDFDWYAKARGASPQVCDNGIRILVLGVDQRGKTLRLRRQLTQEFESFAYQLDGFEANSGCVAARSIEALGETNCNRVTASREDNRNGRGRSFGRKCRGRAAWRGDHGHPAANQISCQFGKPIDLSRRPAEFDGDILALNKASFVQALAECRNEGNVWLRRTGVKKSDHRCRGLLRLPRERPRGCRAAEQRDELAPGAHSITSSARASTVAGMSRPSAFAVLRLMTSSYLVGACTGRSAGFSPLRMRST